MSDLEPKQKRSAATRDRLVAALGELLEDKYFEQIAIAEIAEIAGVSVGAFYRRFKNKEALLPMLYASFQTDLRSWIDAKEPLWQTLPLGERIASMAAGIAEFFGARAGMIRTIHINARIHSHVLEPKDLAARQSDYERLAQCLGHDRSASDLEAERHAIFTIVATVLEKVVYPNLTPAIAAPGSLNESLAQLSRMISAYLRST